MIVPDRSPSDRTVAVIGPGRVGTLLAAALARAGRRVVAVAGGSPQARARLAGSVAGARPVDASADASRAAALLILAVPDDVIEEVVRDLVRLDAVRQGQRIVHVAGSRGLDVLRLAAAAGARTAACHPAMTVPAGARDPDLLVGAAWAVTAAPADRGWVHELVRDLGGDPYDVPEDRRVLYHAGLAVGSNAVGAAVATARRLLLAAGIDDPRSFLDPLVRASVGNVLDRGAEALTGPVVRGDTGTLEHHLDALATDVPELLASYLALTQAVLDQVRVALDPDTVAALEAVLARTATGSPQARRD